MSTYNTKYDKSHDGNGIGFDALSPLPLPQIAISGSQSNGTIQTLAAVPQNSKFMKVSVATLAISGAATVQVVAGSAAVGAVGTANKEVASGTPLTSAAIAVPAVGKQTTVVCDVPDAVVAGLPLTLRATTAANNTATVQVTVFGCPVDPEPDSVAGASAKYNNASPNNW